MEFIPFWMMVSVALMPTAVGLIWVYRGDRQFKRGLKGLTGPKGY